MNRLPLLLALFLLLPALLRAQSPEQLFNDGNQAYQRGDIGRAVELYESILRNGCVAGDLSYNLGNAYYRSGNIARAILNYERARRLMPDDEDLRHNLQLAGLMITDRIEPAPRLFLWEWWEGVKEGVPLRTATWIAYACFVLFLGTLCLLLLGRRFTVRRAGLWGSVAMLLLLGLSLVLLFAKMTDMQRKDEAVILQNVATVKNSPDEKSTDAFVLHAGVKVELTDRVGAWLKIRIADGKVGWVPEEDLEVI